MNEAKSGSGSLAYSGIVYSDPQIAAIKYSPNYAGRRGGKMALVMDRTVGNMLEQQPAFLVSTWLHAIIVPGGSRAAALVGFVYILSRVLYPALFWIGHPWLQISTVPGYLSIWCERLPHVKLWLSWSTLG